MFTVFFLLLVRLQAEKERQVKRILNVKFKQSFTVASLSIFFSLSDLFSKLSK